MDTDRTCKTCRWCNAVTPTDTTFHLCAKSAPLPDKIGIGVCLSFPHTKPDFVADCWERKTANPPVSALRVTIELLDVKTQMHRIAGYAAGVAEGEALIVETLGMIAAAL